MSRHSRCSNKHSSNPSSHPSQQGRRVRFVSARALHRQSGISLIELLVSMTIGLIISAGAAALFANTILSTRTLNSASQIQEAGTQLSQTLTRQLRMTGYADWLETPDAVNTVSSGSNKAAYNLASTATQTLFETRYAQAALHGCDGGYSAVTSLNNTGCNNATLTNGLPTQSGFTIAYQVQGSNAVTARYEPDGAPSLAGFNASKGMMGDCNGQGTNLYQAGTTVRANYAINRYYLNTSTTPAQLYCQGNGGVTQPVASNIEQFTVTYAVAQPNTDPTPGAASPSSDEQVGAYQSAAQITASNAWARVISVRTCLMVVGELGSLATASNASVSTRKDCTGTGMNLADRRLRQTFTNTIALRNQIHTANQAQ